jgi:GDP-L-fucose synthase
MRILITGTNGFIGRNLKELFAVRYPELHCPLRQQLNLLDTEAVQVFLTRHHFDAVIHCAVNINSVDETLRMYFNLERCASHYGKLISIGSGAEYDNRHYVPAISEDRFGAYIPCDVYGFAKYVIARDIESKPRNIVNLRGFGIFGKHENHRRRFISNNIYRALSGQDLTINRNMRFDFLYVDDFAKIIELFLLRDNAHPSYNVCTGQPTDFLSLATLIRKIHGKGLAIRIKEDGMNPEYSGSNARLLSEFGSICFTPIETAVTALYDWYRKSSNITFDAEPCSFEPVRIL